jgi:uncharacterized hydrophobic protein (TIGR00271 family)
VVSGGCSTPRRPSDVNQLDLASLEASVTRLGSHRATRSQKPRAATEGDDRVKRHNRDATGRRAPPAMALRLPDGYRWWRRAVIDTVDHPSVIARIAADSGWSPRYAFMTMMSAGIAVLGLLLSSPAVVIGAMLISPLMDPILGFGFSLAMFDFHEARRSLAALAIGCVLAVTFTALIVLLSPLREVTAEILARTRPNLFDMAVALFAALAGAFAIIRGRGGTIVGVAIATALMPPLAVVGYGLATWNLPVLGGALALFGTNFVTIALAAAIMARLHGFGHYLSSHQTWIQTLLLLVVFAALALPLGFSLSRIASEAVTVTQLRGLLSDQFGAASRVTQLAVDFEAKPLRVRTVVIAPRSKSVSNDRLRVAMEKKLGRPVALQVDQILLDRNASSIDAQRAQLQQQSEAETAEKLEGERVVSRVAIAAGISADSVLVDRAHKRVAATAISLPHADLTTYRALETRAGAAAAGWRITIVPPFQPLPLIHFANGADTLDDAAHQAVLSSAWAAVRWNIATLGVPGLPPAGKPAPRRPSLSQRRAQAIAEVLRGHGVSPATAPPAGQTFRLSLVPAKVSP